MRFGDPEAQVVLPMLDEDLSWLLGARGDRRAAVTRGAVQQERARRRRARRRRLSRTTVETGKTHLGPRAAAADVPSASCFTREQRGRTDGS